MTTLRLVYIYTDDRVVVFSPIKHIDWNDEFIRHPYVKPDAKLKELTLKAEEISRFRINPVYIGSSQGQHPIAKSKSIDWI